MLLHAVVLALGQLTIDKFDKAFQRPLTAHIVRVRHWIPSGALSVMLPKAGVFAHAQALVVAHRIAAEIGGAAPSEQFCGDGFCMLEAGDDLAGVAFGDFFHQPSPDVHVKSIGRAWHLGKVLFEQWWLLPWGTRRSLLKSALAVGSRIYGVPVNL